MATDTAPNISGAVNTPGVNPGSSDAGNRSDPAATPVITNEPVGKPQLSSVGDALKSNVQTIPAPKEDANEAERKNKDKEAPIESVAQLRDWHVRRGTQPTTDEVNEVRELENKIAEEGGKKLRTNPTK